MAIVSGIEVTQDQLAELAGIDYGNELHLIEEPDGRVTIDNGDTIVVEFVLQGEVGLPEIDFDEVSAPDVLQIRVDELLDESVDASPIVEVDFDNVVAPDTGDGFPPANSLTNRERRENVAFLMAAWDADGNLHPYTPLQDGGTFEDECMYQILATQNTREAIVNADWFNFVEAGVTAAILEGPDGGFDIRSYALDPPVTRAKSKGKVIDWIRFKEMHHTWERLLPVPEDPLVTVDTLHAFTGGALKARAFQVINSMLRFDFWTDDALVNYSYMPTQRVRKRASRMGLTDLPEKPGRFADLKAYSRALHAVMRIGEAPRTAGVSPLIMSGIRCEACNATRMATCAMPHCKFRRDACAQRYPAE